MSTSSQHHRENQDNKENSSQVVVVMVPFPAQSHLNQLLQLSHVISSYNVPVHYICSAIHNSRVKSRSKHQTPESKIQFHDIPIPSLVSLPPNPNSKTRFPEEFLPCFEASTLLHQPVSSLIQSLSLTTRRLVIIHDDLMASAVQDNCSLPNTEAYSFYAVSAFFHLTMTYEALGRKFVPMEDGKLMEICELPSMESCFPSVLLDYGASQVQSKTSQAGKLHNTCRSLEGHFLELLGRDEIVGRDQKKHWAIGPLQLYPTTNGDISKGSHKCLEWLDKQEPKSVLYVSFGTSTTLREEEIEELALGLEKSGTKFIWVLRDADKVNDFNTEDVKRAQHLKGFEERMEGTGMVLRDWVPQLEILGHPSTGGFMSHCGWNSCMESIGMGVPIAAWPMHSDQPRNAVLLTEVLKVGVAVIKWTQRNELVTSSTISEAVKKLMVSEEGNEIRKRCEEMGEAVRKSMDGEVTREWDSFVSHISR